MTQAGTSASSRVRGFRSVLIATNPKDADSFLVQAALHRKGVQAELAHFPDFPGLSKASLYVGSSPVEDQWRLVSRDDHSPPKLPDTVWWRRPEPPVVPSDVHPEDREFVLQETTKLLLGLWHHLPSETVCVNSPGRAAEADRKPYQIRIAREVGFAIPPTLFSNDPADIRASIRKWGGRAIYKPLGSLKNFWWDHQKQKLVTLFTTAIGESSLPDDRTLTLTPGIYQPLLPKAFDLRVTVFGSTVFGTKIFSQEQERSHTDWRNGQRTLRYEPFEVGTKISQLCTAMLRKLDILMGCFDFIMTPDREIIFLEVNEGGQFLWLESTSGAPILDAFSDFLIQPRADFRWRPSPDPLRIQRVQSIAAERMAEAAEAHVDPEPFYLDAAKPAVEVKPDGQKNSS